MLNHRLVIAAGAAAALWAGPASLGATVTYSFSNITGNSAIDAALGESQLRMDVSLAGANANFRLYHAGLTPMAIASVYFDDRSPRLTAPLAPTGIGASFAAGGAPPVLPGGATLSPTFVETFRFAAANPKPFQGVNPGDEINFQFAFASGGFDDLIADLNSGSLRVGMHVISFSSGGSESFVGIPMETVPLPSAAGLGLAGLGVLGAGRRRRN